MGAQFLSSRPVSARSGHGLTDWVRAVSLWACAEMSALIIQTGEGEERNTVPLFPALVRATVLSSVKKGLGPKHRASGAVDLKSALFKGGKRFAERKLTCIFWSLIDSIFFPPGNIILALCFEDLIF